MKQRSSASDNSERAEILFAWVTGAVLAVDVSIGFSAIIDFIANDSIFVFCLLSIDVNDGLGSGLMAGIVVVVNEVFGTDSKMLSQLIEAIEGMIIFSVIWDELTTNGFDEIELMDRYCVGGCESATDESNDSVLNTLWTTFVSLDVFSETSVILLLKVNAWVIWESFEHWSDVALYKLDPICVSSLKNDKMASGRVLSFV